MKRVLYWLATHGYPLMGIGMALILAGVFILFDERRRLGSLRIVALALAITGGVCYVGGRVCVVIERRIPKPPDNGEL